MSKQSLSHIERTAHEPRDPSLHTLTIAHITQVTPTIRLFRLAIPPTDTIKFLPGQWIDLHPPPSARVAKPGGFTITSSPSLALPSEQNPSPYIELAIQASPLNPAAAYLFLPAPHLLHTPVQVRIGGSFVFPPLSSSPDQRVDQNEVNDDLAAVRKVVFVAGGMGINPLMSMLSFIGEQESGGGGDGLEVEVLYSVKDPGASDGNSVEWRNGAGILFLERIVGLFESGRVKGGLRLFLTGGGAAGGGEGGGEKGVVRCSGGVDVPFSRRRVTVGDVEEALGGEKEAALVYVCGVPGMTDEFVGALVSPAGVGMERGRVLFEKWW